MAGDFNKSFGHMIQKACCCFWPDLWKRISTCIPVSTKFNSEVQSKHLLAKVMMTFWTRVCFGDWQVGTSFSIQHTSVLPLAILMGCCELPVDAPCQLRRWQGYDSWQWSQSVVIVFAGLSLIWNRSHWCWDSLHESGHCSLLIVPPSAAMGSTAFHSSIASAVSNQWLTLRRFPPRSRARQYHRWSYKISQLRFGAGCLSSPKSQIAQKLWTHRTPEDKRFLIIYA